MFSSGSKGAASRPDLTALGLSRLGLVGAFREMVLASPIP